jgi:hypothetical protein
VPGKLATILLGILSISIAAQAMRTAQRSVERPPLLRTPDGRPDLQGVWSNGTTTPLERPIELGLKEFYTETELAEVERQDVSSFFKGLPYGDYWYDRGKPTNRTSLIVDPPNGRVPPLTDAAMAGEAARREAGRGRGPSDSWEDRSLHERCITRSNMPRLPAPYNNYCQILQTPTAVVILYEMIHEVRIIPLDGRPHLGPGLRQWLGDSRGRWEGNTLVVDTTNFSNKAPFRGSGEQLHGVERFTRLDRDTIDYEVTFDDPATFTRSWTVAFPLTRAKGPILEYACHEGNYGMVGILAGARAEERRRAGAGPR